MANRFTELVESITDEVKAQALALVTEQHEEDPDEYPETTLMEATAIYQADGETREVNVSSALESISDALALGDEAILTADEAASLRTAVGESWDDVERDEHGWPVNTTLEERMAFNKIMGFLQEVLFYQQFAAMLKGLAPDTDENDEDDETVAPI